MDPFDKEWGKCRRRENELLEGEMSEKISTVEFYERTTSLVRVQT